MSMIPPNIYYDAIGEFCAADTCQSMGKRFFQQWYPLRYQFPQSAAAAFVPKPALIPDFMRRIGEQIRTQDEQCTADAMFVVEVKRLLIGFDTDYSQGPEDIVWCCDGTNTFMGDPDFDALEMAYENSGAVPEDYSRHCYTVHWDFVTAFLTEYDSSEFVKRHGHKYDGELRVTVECERRNEQWAMLRDWLMSLAPVEKVGAA